MTCGEMGNKSPVQGVTDKGEADRFLQKHDKTGGNKGDK